MLILLIFLPKKGVSTRGRLVIAFYFTRPVDRKRTILEG